MKFVYGFIFLAAIILFFRTKEEKSILDFDPPLAFGNENFPPWLVPVVQDCDHGLPIKVESLIQKK